MKNEMILPTKDLYGTAFTVDVFLGELREVGNPHNIMRFTDMHDNLTHYEFPYDKKLKNFPMAYTPNSIIVNAKLERMTQLHPEGMAKRFSIRRTGIEQKFDRILIENENLYQQRLKGFLPVIEIGEQNYSVNLVKAQFKPYNKDLPILNLRDFEYNDTGEKITALFDVESRKIVKPNIDQMLELPAGVMMLSLPKPMYLDPVGCAIEYKMEPRTLLNLYPIHANLKGELIPLQNTELANIVEYNLKRHVQNKELPAPEDPIEELNMKIVQEQQQRNVVRKPNEISRKKGNKI